MSEEFCLSDRVRKLGISPKCKFAIKMKDYLFVKDVKEFIKLRNDINLEIVKWGNKWAEYVNEENILKFWNKGIGGAKEIKEKIDKLAGEGLK